jgi:hypothetical protein
LTRTAAPKPIATKLERRRKKNKREKPSRRRTRTMSLYGDGNALRSLIMLMYADA